MRIGDWPPRVRAVLVAVAVFNLWLWAVSPGKGDGFSLIAAGFAVYLLLLGLRVVDSRAPSGLPPRPRIGRRSKHRKYRS